MIEGWDELEGWGGGTPKAGTAGRPAEPREAT